MTWSISGHSLWRGYRYRLIVELLLRMRGTHGAFHDLIFKVNYCIYKAHYEILSFDLERLYEKIVDTFFKICSVLLISFSGCCCIGRVLNTVDFMDEFLQWRMSIASELMRSVIIFQIECSYLWTARIHCIDWISNLLSNGIRQSEQRRHIVPQVCRLTNQILNRETLRM